MGLINLASEVNLPLIGAIIGILLAVRGLDTKGKLARGFYIIAVLVLGFAGGLLVTNNIGKELIIAGIIHAGAASILYQTGKLIVPSQKDFKLFHKGKDQ